MPIAIKHGWPDRAVWIGAAVIALILAFLQTWAEMVHIWWTSSTFNHCLLIVPISLYLVWLKRAQIAAHRPGVSWLAPVFVLLNSSLWLVGALMSISFFQHLAVVGMLLGTVWALLGNTVFRLLLFPLCYLYFSVPEGEVLVPYLQDWTAKVLVTLLRWSGIPVYIEGRYLTIPSGVFVVAEACSGINYLIATLAVGTMFAYLRYVSNVRRALFMVLVIAVPLIANGLRAYGIVMIAHLSDHKYAVGVDHIIFGWLFFGVVILVLFSIGNMFSDAGDAAEPPRPAPARAGGNPVLAAGVSLLVAMSGPAVMALTAAPAPGAGLLALPTAAGWQGPEPVPSLLQGHYAGASQRLAGRYRKGDATVTVEVAHYLLQIQGAELVNQVNTVYARRDRWRRVAQASREVVRHGREQKVQEVELRDPLGEVLVWYWYDVEGVATVRDLTAKLLEVKTRFTGRRYGSAAVAIATRFAGEPAEGARVLEEFLREVEVGLPALNDAP